MAADLENNTRLLKLARFIRCNLKSPDPRDEHFTCWKVAQSREKKIVFTVYDLLLEIANIWPPGKSCWLEKKRELVPLENDNVELLEMNRWWTALFRGVML